MKISRRSTLLGFVIRGLCAAFIATAFAHAQLPESTKPKYVPPSCQGKPITVVPPDVMAAIAPTEVKPNPPISKGEQLIVFDTLAKIISEVYVYPDYNGLNWPAVVSEVRAKVEKGLDTEAYYTEMGEFVRKLGDRHSYFESPARVVQSDTSLAGANKYAGIGVMVRPMLEKHRVSIMAVMPGTSADHNGLKQHDSILAADGFPMVANGVLYQQRVRGPECSAVVLTIQSPGQEPRKITVIRHQVSAPAPIYASLVATTNGSRIGYIFLPSFFDVTLPDQVKNALAGFGQLDGLIIDNRMNGGGSSKVLLPILSFFASGTLGHFVAKSEKRPLEIVADPVSNSQKVPMVILVSKQTVSYGEVFSGTLQDIGRAKIVGQATSGRVETLHGFKFRDGSRAWIAKERFDPIRSHTDWRGRGVKPDVESYADWDTFTFENDPAVSAAVKLLGRK